MANGHMRTSRPPEQKRCDQKLRGKKIFSVTLILAFQLQLHGDYYAMPHTDNIIFDTVVQGLKYKFEEISRRFSKWYGFEVKTYHFICDVCIFLSNFSV